MYKRRTARRTTDLRYAADEVLSYRATALKGVDEPERQRVLDELHQRAIADRAWQASRNAGINATRERKVR
jgi:hypothetical protein